MDTPEVRFEPRGLFIGGEWQEAARGGSFKTVNPATGSALGEVPLATEDDVDRAVRSAYRAYQQDWGKMSLKERARSLELLADRLAEHRDELGLLDCLDSGNTLPGMKGDVDWTVETLRYFAGLISEIKGETFSRESGHLNLTRRQPFGVVAKINPFNHPFRFCAEKAAAALAAGNTVVIKGPEQAPLSSLRLGELCADLMPPGAVNIVTGDGKTGSAMVRHPLVERIGFVGSVETGKIIAREAALGLKQVSLELGGKNPIIILPDADPAEAARQALRGMNMDRQGQSCSSTSRVLVHRSLHREVRESLIQELDGLRLGLPWRKGVDVGPVVSEAQMDRVVDLIESGKHEGATLLAGGGHPSDPELANGYFVQLTLFDNVTPDLRIAREEIFGPVMSLMPWDDYDEMIEIANGLEYGLTASIVTRDLALAMETAERVEAGYVWINSRGRYLGAPYGGWKQSGLGQEECFDELVSYTRLKNINLRW